jgi:hypothetical protein
LHCDFLPHACGCAMRIHRSPWPHAPHFERECRPACLHIRWRPARTVPARSGRRRSGRGRTRRCRSACLPHRHRAGAVYRPHPRRDRTAGPGQQRIGAVHRRAASAPVMHRPASETRCQRSQLRIDAGQVVRSEREVAAIIAGQRERGRVPEAATEPAVPHAVAVDDRVAQRALGASELKPNRLPNPALLIVSETVAQRSARNCQPSKPSTKMKELW